MLAAATICAGVTCIGVPLRHPLREAAEVHCAIEAHQTTGSTVLLPFAWRDLLRRVGCQPTH